MMEGSYDFNRWNHLVVSHTPAKFGGYGHLGSGYIMVLVCLVILTDHVTKGSSNIMGRNPSKLVTILPGLGTIGTVVVER